MPQHLLAGSTWLAPANFPTHSPGAHPPTLLPDRPHSTSRSANVSNGVPQPTDCQFSISIGGGGQTIFQVWGFRGSNPASPVPTDLLTDKNKAFSPQE